MPETFLERVPRDELPEPLREAWRKSMAVRGDATFFEAFGNHPELYDWYVNSFYKEVFYGGKVSRRVKEMIRLRLSQAHGCRFCNQGNRLDAREAGLTDEEIDALAAAGGDYENGPFTGPERAALRLADQMLLTNPNGALSKPLYEELRGHFSDGEILELGLVLGVLTGMAKFLFAFNLVEKEDNCPIKGEPGS